MDLGHMQRDEKYLEDVVSFAYVVVVGEAYRLNETVRQDPAQARLGQRAGGAGGDPRQPQGAGRAGPRVRRVTLRSGRRGEGSAGGLRAESATIVAGVEKQLAVVSEKLKQVALSDDTGATDKLRAEQTALRLRLNTNRLRLRVAEEVAKHPGARIPVEERKVRDVRDLLLGSVADAGRALDSTATPVG